ncbi:GIY-YIG nuclease family protein [Caenimonas aquaedulcis]
MYASQSGGEVGRWRKSKASRGGGGYDQNHGVAGVVYILQNEGFKEGFYKLGCSRHSGHARAANLNVNASTGVPGSFKCIFEQRTRDCGRAEQLVFQRLHAHRKGKWGQEFFEVDLDVARRTIITVCAEVDATHVVVQPPPPPPARFISPSVVSVSQAPYVPPATPPRGKSSSNAGTWIFGVVFVAFVVWVNQPKSKSSSYTPPPAAYTVSPAPAPAPSPRPVAAVARSPQAEYKAPPKPATVEQVTPLALTDQNAPPGQARHLFPDQARALNREELASIESVCWDAKHRQGPGAYRDCTQKHRDSIAGTEAPNLSGLNQVEQASIQSACWDSKNRVGPKSYGDCVRRNLQELSAAERPDTQSLSAAEQASLSSACWSAKQQGPATYYKCVRVQMNAMEGQGRADLSGLNAAERQSANSACWDQKQRGPASFQKCLIAKVNDAEAVAPVDLSGLTAGERQSIESVCWSDKNTKGPAAYRRCLSRHLATLR